MFLGLAAGREGIGTMGKGDRRSKRGKVSRGTFGKRRPKSKPDAKAKPAAAAAPVQG